MSMDFGKRRKLRHVTLSRQTQRQPEPKRGKRRKNGKQLPAWKMVLILTPLLVISGVIGAGIALGWKTYTAVSAIVVDNENTGILYNGTDSASGKTPIMQWDESDERINILILGLDRRSWEQPATSRADTILLMSIDPVEDTIFMFSIPRDLQVTYTNETGGTSLVKINAVHVLANDAEDRASGPKAMKRVVSEVLGVNVHYFLRLDFEGFRQIIDEVGGITVNVEYPLVDYQYPDEEYGYQIVDIQPGLQVMDGETALMYARSRHALHYMQQGDQNRARRQQEVSVALKEKMLASKWDIVTDPTQLSNLLDTMQENFLTDIQVEEMIKLAQELKDIDTNNPHKVASAVLGSPYIYHEDRAGVDWRYYPRDPDWQEIHNYLSELLDNPFLQQQLEDEAALIRVENGTARPGLASETQYYLEQNYNLVFQQAVNADRNTYEDVVIYDLSNGEASVTVDFLERFFNEQAEPPEVLYPGEEADIIIIVGDNYSVPTN